MTDEAWNVERAAARASSALSDWSAHGFAAGFFGVLQGPSLRLPAIPSTAVVFAGSKFLTLPGETALPQDIEARVSFVVALSKACQKEERRLVARRRRLTMLGIWSGFVAMIAVLAAVTALAFWVREWAAVALLVTCTLAFFSIQPFVARRETYLLHEASAPVDAEALLPWRDTFAATFRKLEGTVDPSLDLGF